MTDNSTEPAPFNGNGAEDYDQAFLIAEGMNRAEIPAENAMPGRLLRLVTDGLIAHGFGVEPHEDEHRISVTGRGGCCDLLVSDSGLIEWECGPWAGSKADPKLIADIAAFLLTGKDEDYPRGDGSYDTRGLSFKGIVGTELRARGFDVSLEVCEDNGTFEVTSEILATRPVTHSNAGVRITGDGAISRECDYPYEVTAITGTPEYFAVLASPGKLAHSIAATVAHAIELSSGIFKA